MIWSILACLPYRLGSEQERNFSKDGQRPDASRERVELAGTWSGTRVLEAEPVWYNGKQSCSIQQWSATHTLSRAMTDATPLTDQGEVLATADAVRGLFSPDDLEKEQLP